VARSTPRPPLSEARARQAQEAGAEQKDGRRGIGRGSGQLESAGKDTRASKYSMTTARKKVNAIPGSRRHPTCPTSLTIRTIRRRIPLFGRDSWVPGAFCGGVR
jgi:hypothetical protein